MTLQALFQPFDVPTGSTQPSLDLPVTPGYLTGVSVFFGQISQGPVDVAIFLSYRDANASVHLASGVVRSGPTSAFAGADIVSWTGRQPLYWRPYLQVSLRQDLGALAVASNLQVHAIVESTEFRDQTTVAVPARTVIR